MRRFDKKQNILEANLQLESRFLSKKITEEEELDLLLKEVKEDFKNSLTTEINEGLTMVAISAALSGGKLLDLLSAGLKKLTNWAVKKGILSKDGKAYNKSEKAQAWLQKNGEKWSKKIMSFFKWVAGGIVNVLIKNENFDTNKKEEITDRLGVVLFYMTIGTLGFSALSHFSDVGTVKQLLTMVKGYELVIAAFAFIMWMAHQEVNKHSLRDTVHTLEQCVEGQTGKLVKSKKFREKMVGCTLENIKNH